MSQGLGADDLGHVEQLLDGVHPDHAGLAEQSGDGIVGAGQGGGMRRGGPAPDGAPAALHGDDGLGTAQFAGQASELPRVAERLEVQQTDAGGVVLGPPARAGRCR